MTKARLFSHKMGLWLKIVWKLFIWLILFFNIDVSKIFSFPTSYHVKQRPSFPYFRTYFMDNPLLYLRVVLLTIIDNFIRPLSKPVWSILLAMGGDHLYVHLCLEDTSLYRRCGAVRYKRVVRLFVIVGHSSRAICWS